MDRTITEIINNDYRRYAMYTIENRAIPHMIDGFKPVHRKIFYVSRKLNKQTKISSIGGMVVNEAQYFHGSASVESAAILLAKDFTGGNNIPMLIGDGEFGSQLIPDGAASPRYITAKINPKFEQFFADYEILPKSIDIETPEPLFYLPIIPTILLNGISGIAVGFATEIQPYDIKDIRAAVKKAIAGAQIKRLTPSYKGYNGVIQFDEERGKFVMYGTFFKVNTTTIQVTEVPVSMNREKYIKHLDKLQEKGLIHDYEDSSDSKWNITIKLPRNSKVWDAPEEHLKLATTLNENITVIDKDGKLKIYNDVTELIKDFVEFRLSVYTERKRYNIEKATREISEAKLKISYIVKVIILFEDNGVKTKKEDFEKIIEAIGANEYKQKFLSMPIQKFNFDTIEEIEDEITELDNARKYYEEVEECTLYEQDLASIKI